MKDIDFYIPITEAKSRLLDVIRKVENNDDIIAITKNGVPTAVLLSVERFEGILETIDILTDEKAMRSLRKSIKEAGAGKWTSHDSLFKEE
ncbi:MAG TPA: type II toxin-antitoxin system Phd/YefM family antitoxin [Thermodesulfobacteriota bacterium]|nr:type II toxin-antitoxin system Phd/YefM family antitoxin [Thermodesulfobacteriota bacterium]